jgi:hypothetical protein
MAEEGELACVYTCQGWHLAQIYKSKLEAAGIPVLLEYESAALVFGLTVDGLGQVRIMVSEADANDAQALLAETDEPLPEETEGEDEGLPEP